VREITTATVTLSLLLAETSALGVLRLPRSQWREKDG